MENILIVIDEAPNTFKFYHTNILTRQFYLKLLE